MAWHIFGIFLFVFLEYLQFFYQTKWEGKLPKGTMKLRHVSKCNLFVYNEVIQKQSTDNLIEGRSKRFKIIRHFDGQSTGF